MLQELQRRLSGGILRIEPECGFPGGDRLPKIALQRPQMPRQNVKLGVLMMEGDRLVIAGSGGSIVALLEILQCLPMIADRLVVQANQRSQISTTASAGNLDGSRTGWGSIRGIRAGIDGRITG